MLRALSTLTLAAACMGAGADTPDPTRAEPWVRRQQAVVAESRVGDVVVELPALALADGREGDVIQVRLASGRPIRSGRVSAPGRVSL
jgi:flagella basal body P-ring formation protein FlgA